ncbi:MAG: AlbA family DNA-binding domain-containing protein [Candidatus Helarchaeota archaeon]
MVDLNILNVISELVTTYNSFIYRCAIMKKKDNWENILSSIIFTDLTSDDLSKKIESFDQDKEKIDLDNFKILYQIFEINDWKEIFENISKNSLSINSHNIYFRKEVNLENINCHHETWSSYIQKERMLNITSFSKLTKKGINFFEGVEAHNDMDFHNELKEITPDIRQNTYYPSIYSAIETLLGVRDFRGKSLSLIIILPIHAKIKKYSLDKNLINFVVIYHKNLSQIVGSIELKSNGSRDNIPYLIQKENIVDINRNYSQYSIEKEIPSLDRQKDTIFIHLAAPSIPIDLDRVEIRKFESYYGSDISLEELLELSFSDLMKEDESIILEFKSSLRYDYKTDRANKDLEYEVAKEIAAFMNSTGGILVIGIRDDPRDVLGIENDYKVLPKRMRNKDGYQLKLNQIILKLLGNVNTEFINIWFEEIQGLEVCLIKVTKYPEPIFLTQKEKVKFIIRFGNQTQSLNIREAVSYILRHWNYNRDF